jgi:hypothetical protein
MNDSTQTNSPTDETLFEASYQKVLPEMQSLSTDELTSVNLDVSAAIATVLGAVRELSKHRAAIEKELPAFNLARLERLEDYAKALSHAQTVYMTAIAPPDELRENYEEGVRLRDVLHSDVAALIRRGLVESKALKEYRGTAGHKNVAIELQILSQVLKENWKTIEGKCAVSLGEIDQALKIAARLLRGVGERELGPAAAAEANDLRTRAFTLLFRAYDDARRAMIFLRWHDEDADEIAPSLYASRGGSSRGGAKKKSEGGATEASPAGTDKPSMPATGATAPAAATTAPAAGTNHGNDPKKSGGEHGPFLA